jgi:TM2 domain-containing membrane protein YozV
LRAASEEDDTMNMATTADTPMPRDDMVACRACRESIHNTAPICTQCGASQRSRGYKSKVAAGLLSIFLGGLGIHRFYLGQWWGIFYLLFFWAYIPGLIALVEGIVFLCRDQEKWDARHNEGKASMGGESSAGLVVGLVVAAFGGIFVLGILAAVAIPAYQDYAIKARVVQSTASMDQAKSAVGQYILTQKAYPSSNADVGLSGDLAGDNLQSLEVIEGGAIVLTFNEKLGAVAGKTLIYRPVVQDHGIDWTCAEGTLIPRYRTPACR